MALSRSTAISSGDAPCLWIHQVGRSGVLMHYEITHWRSCCVRAFFTDSICLSMTSGLRGFSTWAPICSALPLHSLTRPHSVTVAYKRENQTNLEFRLENFSHLIQFLYNTSLVNQFLRPMLSVLSGLYSLFKSSRNSSLDGTSVYKYISSNWKGSTHFDLLHFSFPVGNLLVQVLAFLYKRCVGII